MVAAIYSVVMLGNTAGTSPADPHPLAVFADHLRECRMRAGEPSIRVLEKLTRDLGCPYPRSTIYGKLQGKSAPDWKFVETFVRACARNGGIPDASTDLGSWRAAHRQLLADLAGLRNEQRERLRGTVAASAMTAILPDAVFAAARREYLDRLRQRYRSVDLEVLTPLTEQGDHPEMLLGNVFTPQLVRPDPPPVELPRELWRRLAKAGEVGDDDLPDGVDRDLLDRTQKAYQDRPARPVLDVVAGPAGQKLVLLGDPGAGKSALARYLVLALADATGRKDNAATVEDGALEGLAGWLPLLVELRSYAEPQWRDRTFLDLIDHLHISENLGLPRAVLEAFLQDGGRAVMVFDGLDEVFDPRTREQITRQIEAFAARYRQTRVIVTSRAIGYRRAILDAAGFTHHMLQDLEPDQIRRFATAWYRSSCPGSQGDAARLRERLLGAVEDSAAVAELAGNPMLLTILAIIGRRQELPRDRRAVYEHAVSVLVEHWDATGKHLHDVRVDGGMPYLGHQDKLELLRLVARRMQNGPAGLAGNHLPGPDLLTEFDAYLRERFELPASRAIPAAKAMLEQLRERNFILARFGAGVYGFVHRAFLECLAAADICQRFSAREMTEDDLLQFFSSHWDDPSWHEVLLLIAGMIPGRFAGQAIDLLLAIDNLWYLRSESLPWHVLLAIGCLACIFRDLGWVA